MSDNAKRLLKRVFLGVLVLWITVQAVIWLARNGNREEAHQKATALLEQAQRDANADMTKEDAIRWFRQHGMD